MSAVRAGRAVGQSWAEAAIWRRPLTPPELGDHDVHIWRAELDVSDDRLAALQRCLSPDELARAERYVLAQGQRRFIAARGILRILVARYLCLAPGGREVAASSAPTSALWDAAAAIEFGYTPSGKPFLAHSSLAHFAPGHFAPTRGLVFNLSHAEGLAVYAFARNRSWGNGTWGNGTWGETCGAGVAQGIPFQMQQAGALQAGQVGIDIEFHRYLPNLRQLAADVFTADELAVLDNLPVEQQSRAFYAGWTRKEAFVKAVGQGLGYPLQDFAVTLAPGAVAQLIHIGGDCDAAAGWQMASFVPGAGFSGAVVVQGDRLGGLSVGAAQPMRGHELNPGGPCAARLSFRRFVLSA